tara:strand:- start:482 stop:682 length:201 start_codon:yes stop_codon:yes gene_type:complete
MGELQAVNDISPFTAVLWIFYPMALLVGIELFLRALRDDDDDDQDGGKGIRVTQTQMQYATAPTGA